MTKSVKHFNVEKSVYQIAEQKFNDVSAYVIMKDDKHICNITLKYPRDGMGRVHGFIHCFGLHMVHDFVSGGGYDKRSAVICKLARKQIANIKSIIDCEEKEQVKIRYADYIDLCNHIIGNGEAGWDIGIHSKFKVIRVI